MAANAAVQHRVVMGIPRLSEHLIEFGVLAQLGTDCCDQFEQADPRGHPLPPSACPNQGVRCEDVRAQRLEQVAEDTVMRDQERVRADAPEDLFQ
jgi:hypothetical protein